MWDKLEVTYEGTNEVKETKISILVHEYENFKMDEGERVKQMFERLLMIVNDLHALRIIISKREVNKKILRTLPRSWKPKVDVL